MANIDINSYNQILGRMIRRVIADTPANDINKGSVLLTLLEAAASNDYANNTAILNVLELMNIDSLKNNDLDAYASNFGLERNTARKASGFIKVTDTSITKRSTTLYSIKPAPIAGTLVLYVNDASEWSQTGTLYIGRGTPNFEGPINYTSITDNGTFYTINLSSSLEKDHLPSENVVDGQGTTDRKIKSGTVVKTPANSVTPVVEYTVQRDAVLPAGENTVEDIPVSAVRAGSVGNAGINSITLFNTLPFTDAVVTNTNAFTNGRDTESDEDFRNRIKAYSSTLARGTSEAIVNSIEGVSEDTEGKQVSSAVITEPADIGEPSIVYIDDGSGFEPSYDGQSVDLLVDSANGSEEFLQLSNYPLPRPQIVNKEESPYTLLDGMELKVLVDGVEESVVFNSEDFDSISSATLNEIIVVINNSVESFKARLTEDSTRILIYPVEYKAETIQVSSDNNKLDANSVLKFPVNEFSYISLYKNNERLREIERSASVSSNPFSTWSITSSGNIILSVDGTPDQDRTFTSSDFDGTNFSALTLQDYVDAFNTKFAGVTASASTTGRLILKSNREGSESKIEVVGGSYLDKIFGGRDLYAEGQDSDFALNRQNGNLQIKTDIEEDDIITAGSDDTKGSIESSAASGGTFNLSSDSNSRPAEVVICVDGDRVKSRPVSMAIGSTITITDEGSNTMRITSSITSAFSDVNTGDYIYITNRGDSDGSGTGSWIDSKSCGLFKIISKGEHTNAGTDTYVEVANTDIVTGGPYSVEDSLDIQAFFSDVYPQLWKGVLTPTPASATIKDVVESINNNINNVIASISNTNYVKLTSTTEEGGSIAIPVSVGNASTELFDTAIDERKGTSSHVANKIQDKDTFTIFKRTAPTSTNVWLNRYVYSSLNGALTSAEKPNSDGTGTYSETLTDVSSLNFNQDADYNSSVSITSGQNKKHFRNIKSIIDADNLGTRHSTPRTLFDYRSGDRYELTKNLEISSEDNLVTIIDDDAVAKTVDISFSRTGQVNSGSQSGSFDPTNLAFSANDVDNEPGIDFGTLDVWGTLPSQSNTNFNDYALWFKARNWYRANSASIITRAKEYGPSGENLRFVIEHPTLPDSSNSVFHQNNPEYTVVTYTYGSDASVVTNVTAGDQFSVDSLGNNEYRLFFPGTATVSNINIGNVISISSNSGFSSDNGGTYQVFNKNDSSNYVDVYNPDGSATIDGVKQTETIETVADSSGSLDGTYLVLTAPNGDTIKFWFDIDDSGTLEPNIGATDRSYEVNPATNASAIDVATALTAAILNDSAIDSASNSSGTLKTITLTWANFGPSSVGFDGSPSPNFTYNITTNGVLPTYETLNIASGLQVYPITDTSTSAIVDKINNDSPVLEAAEVTSGSFERATREERSISTDYLAYGHDPNPNNSKHDYTSMYDGISYVLTFQNSNPNFQLKSALTLNGISTVYDMNTVPNPDGSSGEYFKLVPTTVTNLKHHITHKALSQLDIVSNISVSEDNRRLQLKSQKLGSNGSIEIVGGRANNADFSIIGGSQINSYNGTDYLEMKIPSSPNTLAVGQHVKLYNSSGVKRDDRRTDSETIDVVKINDDTYEYRFNSKNTNFNQYVEFTIVDANSIDPSSYPDPGIVWRWTHSDEGSEISIIDDSTGTVSNQPKAYDASGTLGGDTNIELNINDSGSSSTKLDFDIIVTGTPTQADYITFEDSSGNDYVINIDIDGNGTLPTGSTYTNATNKIEVDISSSDTPNQIMSKIISELLNANVDNNFDISISPGASLSDVNPGDIINPIGTLTNWGNTNTSGKAGDGEIAGHTIVNVDSANRFFDVVNPNGAAMSSTEISANSDVIISSSPIIEWNLAHSSRVKINSISVSSGTATATTNEPHKLNVGDTFDVYDIASGAEPSNPGGGTGTVISVNDINQFTYATSGPDASNISPGGFLIESNSTRTRYVIESLGYNNLFRLRKYDGDSPKFTSCGVAVDDLLVIDGTTFDSVNNGEFRVLAVDDDSIIYENKNAVEQLNTYEKFNDFDTEVNWTANSDKVTGPAGAFTNLKVGDWVKKVKDEDTLFVQVTGFDTGNADTATSVTLGSNYEGLTSKTTGHALDQNSSINTGVYLRGIDDVKIIEGDSVRSGDSLFISSNTDNNWFDATNSGTFEIKQYGTDSADGRVFLRVDNESGTAETDIKNNIPNTEFTISESDDNKFSTIRQIAHVAIDDFDDSKRIVYLTPGNRSYKWSQSNETTIESIGKLSYDTDIVTGVDGYKYYTGLLRKVQRIIDGFEPDSTNFPGRKAVGSLIETLPPLPRNVDISIDVTTRDGVNLSEISNEIKSTIINYISDLGVGEDVIMSDIIVRVKNIDGVAAVTFIAPEPSKERITVASNEKAFISPRDISIA